MQFARIAPLFLLLAALLAPALLQAMPKQNESAPDFELRDTGNAVHRLSDYRGKVVLLNFWASWCNECLAEIPSLNAVSGKLRKEGLAVIGISIDRRRRDALTVAGRIDYPVLLDPKGDVFVKGYTITRLPTTIVIDRQGLVVHRIIGKRDFNSDSYVETLRTLLRRKTVP